LADSYSVYQKPLTSDLQMDPNVIYLHDDSGSMGRNYMPESAQIPSGGHYYESAFFNKQYYNPDITYQPPYKWENGRLVSMKNMDVRCNWPRTMSDGFSSTTSCNTNLDKSSAFYVDYVPGFNSRIDNQAGYDWKAHPIVMIDGRMEFDPAFAPEKISYNYETYAFKEVPSGSNALFRRDGGTGTPAERTQTQNRADVRNRACPILFKDVPESRAYYNSYVPAQDLSGGVPSHSYHYSGGNPHAHCRYSYRTGEVDFPSNYENWSRITAFAGITIPGSLFVEARPWCDRTDNPSNYTGKNQDRTCVMGLHFIGDTTGKRANWDSTRGLVDMNLDDPVADFTHKGTVGGNDDQSLEHRVSKFVDDDGEVVLESVPRRRTAREEIRNFMNWYSYYRTRNMAAKSGVSLAFANLVDKNDTSRPSAMMNNQFVRLGYDTINRITATGPGQRSGGTTTTRGQGVVPFRDFPDDDAHYPGRKFVKQFYDWTLNLPASGGTPLRDTLHYTGRYLKTKAPWKEYPPADFGGNEGDGSGKVYGCRRSFAILMTDGAYTGNAANTSSDPVSWDVSNYTSINDADGNKGPEIYRTGSDNVNITSNPAKNRYQYEPVAPFFGENDGIGYGTYHVGDSLADVAMYYWYQDLLPDVPNMVKHTRKNPAFWQHMQTFTIGLGVLGRLSDTEVNGFLADPDPSRRILWTFPTDLDTDYEHIDDLFHAGLNGHGGTSAAEDAGEFVDKLKRLLTEIAGEANTNTALALTNDKSKPKKIDESTLAYRADFNPADWSGELAAYSLCTAADVAATVDNCQNLGETRETPTARVTLGAPDTRNILTALPKSGGAGYAGASFLAATVGLPERILDDAAVFRDKPDHPPCPVPLDAAGACMIAQPRNVEGIKQPKPSGGYPKEKYSAELVIDYVRGDRSHEDSGSSNNNMPDGFRERGSRLADIIHSDPLYVNGAQDYGYGNSALTAAQRSAYQTRLSLNQTDFNTAQSASPPQSWERETLYVGANGGMLHGFNARTLKENFAYVPASVHANLKLFADPDYAHLYFVDGLSNAQDAWLGDWKTVLLGSTGAGGRSYFALDVETPETMGEGNVLWEFMDDELGIALGMAEAGFGCVERETVNNSSGTPVVTENCAAGKDTWFAAFGNGVNSLSDEARLFLVNLGNGDKLADLPVPGGITANGLSTPLLVDADGDLVVDLIYAGDLQGNLWKFNVSDPDRNKWTVNKLLIATDKDGKPQPITTRPTVALAEQLKLGNNSAGNAVKCSTANCIIVSVGTGKLFEANEAANDMTDMSVQSLYVVRDECGKFCSNNVVAERGNLEEKILESVSTKLNVTEEILEGRKFSDATKGQTDFTVHKGYFVDLGLLSPGERVIASPKRTVSKATKGNFIYSTFVPSTDACAGGGEGWTLELSLSGATAQSALFTDGAMGGKIGIGASVVVSGENPRSTVRLSDDKRDTDPPCSSIGIATADGGRVIPAKCGDRRGRQSWRQLR
jgi:type IV pilus assembly protein PilY1